MNMLDVSDVNAPKKPPVQPRARGNARVRSKRVGTRSVIGDLHQAGSLKVVFPRVAGDGLQAVTVNTAGGITGGDQFNATFEAADDTTLTVTTQAAERAYAAKDEVGHLTTTLKVGAGATLNWLPQETILFEASQFARNMQVELTPSARLLFVEPLVFGRTARGEVLRDVMFRDHVRIHRSGRPIFEDAMHLSGDITAHMDRTAGGAGAFASVLFVAPDAEARLANVRGLLPRIGGASLLQPDVLHIRLLAEDSFVLRQSLIPILGALKGDPLPRVWMI